MRILIPAICVFLMTGCGTIKEAYEQRNLVADGRSSKIIKYSSTQPEDLNIILLNGESATEASRNAEQSRLLAKSEVNCNYFVESIHNQRAATNVTLGTLTTIASTAAAIVAGRAAQNLAGTAAVTSSISNSINQEMYSGILMPAITREILETRKQAYEEIVTRQKSTIANYPFSLAITDAVKYHNLCSIPFALVGLVNKAAQNRSATPDVTSAIANIDSEINKIKETLNDKSFTFTKDEIRDLNKRVIELNNQRSTLRSTFALQISTDKNTSTTETQTAQKPAEPSENKKPNETPQPSQVEDTEITSPISIQGLEQPL